MLAKVRLEAHSLRFRVAPTRRVIAVIIAVSLAAACSGGTAGDTAGPATSPSTTNTTTVAPTTSATVDDDGCDDWAVPNDLPIVDDAAVTVTADNHPLLADLRGEVPARYEAVVALSEPGGHRPAPPPTERNGDTVTALLAGLRANTTYTVEVLLLEAGCAVGRTRPVTVTSGSLPDALPPIVVDMAQPEAMHDGITLFNLLDIREGFGIDIGRVEEPPRTGWLVMVDEAGEIVWYHHTNHTMGDAEMLDDGTILVEYNDTLARRIDLRGEVLDEWAGSIITGRYLIDEFGRQVVGDSPIVVDVDSMHHEHSLLPDRTHATLSTEVRILDGFDEPVCGEDPDEFDGSYHLIADIVVLYDPETGAILNEFSLFDYFDPRDDPITFNLCGLPLPWVFPNWLYAPINPLVRDWTHANAIEVDPSTNALLVSIRHLDAVIALRWKDDADGAAGELLWHSGPLGDLELLNGDWHRYQHAPEVGPGSSLLVYENGNRRLGTDGSPNLYSRAVEYVLDPDAKTISQVWEYRAEKDGTPLFAGFVGDVDRLANGNVLIVDGGLNGSDPFPELSARIVEVVPADGSGGDLVWGLEVHGGPGWVVYRAERLPSVYGR